MEKYAILDSNNIAGNIISYNQPLQNPPDNYIEVIDESMRWHKYENGQWSIESYENGTTLEEVKQAKIQELEDDCTKVKDSGFKSSCLGTEKVFDSSPENRNLIIGLAMKASLVANGATLVDSNIDWKAKDEDVCYSWQPSQMITLGVDMSTFLTNTIKHKEQLQQYVNTLTTVEEVNKVTWDTVIPT